MASAVGYEDSDETGRMLSLAGLICAVCTDLVQVRSIHQLVLSAESH